VATRSNPFVKLVIGLFVFGGLGYFFVQSVKETRAEPYEVPRGRLQGWTLTLEMPAAPTDPVVSLRPPSELAGALFRQLFERHAESMSGPVVPAMPLVLQDEFVRAFAGHTTPDALFATAKSSGLAATVLQPRCMAYRRDSSPGVTRQLYFLMFDAPQFTRFRTEIAKLAAAGGRGDVFKPDALSPVLFIAASDTAYGQWLPLQANPTTDCTAPITVS
jgi:hypothetical protein